LSASPNALSPSFSPTTHDYTLPCKTGVNWFDVSMTAAAGSTVGLIAPMASVSAPAQTVSVPMAEDDAAVIQVTTADGAQDQYWIRCLPADFPQIEIQFPTANESPSPGWYLIGSENGLNSYGFAMVVDTNGTPVWYQRSWNGVIYVQFLKQNSLVYSPILGAEFGTNPTGQFQTFDLNTQQTGAVHAIESPTDHHEFLVLANGDYVLTSYPFVSGVNLTGLQNFGSNETIPECMIQEVTPDGTLAWEWRGSQHIDPVKESTYPQVYDIAGQSVVDVFHCNSVDADSDGNFLVSARHLDAVFSINKSSGKIVWKMGGAAYNKDGAQILNLQGAPASNFYRQHDARFLQNGDVTLFDDETAMPGPARGVEYALNLSQSSASLVRQWKADVTSSAMGSCRVQPDGNTVVGWGGLVDTSYRVMSEFDPSGNEVFRLSFVSGEYSYRAVKIPISDLDVTMMRQSAGVPIN
jgi:hypothetical protein